MKKRIRTEITVETHEIWVIRNSRAMSSVLCAECAEQSGMLTPEEAARLLQTSTRAIYRHVEAGQIHFSETTDGGLLVCPESLANNSG